MLYLWVGEHWHQEGWEKVGPKHVKVGIAVATKMSEVGPKQIANRGPLEVERS